MFGHRKDTGRGFSSPRRSLGRWGSAGVLPLLLTLLVPPAGADLLITQDGGRLETRGPWKVEGRRIVYTTPAGELASIRLSEVDIEASEKATAEAKQKQREGSRPAQPAKKKDPVLVLTDNDVARAPVEEGPTAAQAAGAEPAREPGSESAQTETSDDDAGDGGEADAELEGKPTDLRVANWDRRYNPAEQQVEIFGTLRNMGKGLVTTFSLNVRVYDESGEEAGSAEAAIDKDSLPAGEEAGFVASFPGLASVSAAKFELKARGFAPRAE